jgi:hypothetical protein
MTLEHFLNKLDLEKLQQHRLNSEGADDDANNSDYGIEDSASSADSKLAVSKELKDRLCLTVNPASTLVSDPPTVSTSIPVESEERVES